MDKERIINVTRTAEKFWLVATSVLSILVVYIIYNEGFEENTFLLLIPALAGFWYIIRRTFRKRLERDLGK